MPTQDTFSQAGGWLRGNRAGIEMLIDTSKSMLELINNVRTQNPASHKVRGVELRLTVTHSLRLQPAPSELFELN